MNQICLLQIMHISSPPLNSLGSGLYRPETEAASDGTVTGSCMIFFLDRWAIDTSTERRSTSIGDADG